jgi:hypothetical protein
MLVCTESVKPVEEQGTHAILVLGDAYIRFGLHHISDMF